jgi:hypothetical protein
MVSRSAKKDKRSGALNPPHEAGDGKSRPVKIAKISAKASKIAASAALSRQATGKQSHDKKQNIGTLVQLTSDQRLDAFRDGAAAARRETFALGRPVTESRDGILVRVWPDGRVETVTAVGHDD